MTKHLLHAMLSRMDDNFWFIHSSLLSENTRTVEIENETTVKTKSMRQDVRRFRRVKRSMYIANGHSELDGSVSNRLRIRKHY
jgi:hypothetical protein